MKKNVNFTAYTKIKFQVGQKIVGKKIANF